MDATDRVGRTGPTAPESAPRVRVAGTVRRGPLVGLALACHPGPALAVTALACALAVGAGLDGARAALVTAAVRGRRLRRRARACHRGRRRTP
ncbi:UbiA family prenyltransferase, partial [Streptomyces californicus]